MISNINVKIQNSNNFYDDFEFTDEELVWLESMADEGLEQEAIDIFVEEYIVKPGTKYQDVVSKYLGDSEVGILSSSESNKLIRNVVLLSIGLIALLTFNFNKFLRQIYSKKIFSDEGLEDVNIKNAILKEVMAQYEQLISGSMAQTQTFIINGIRTLQREMITKNLILKKSKITGTSLDQEVKLFKMALRKKYPSLYKAMEEGNVLMSRRFGTDLEQVRYYKLNYYADMATRTTILNVNRNTVEIMARVNSERVVGFVLVDSRIVKKDRIICQEILTNKVLGRSILALDDEAASILGVLTVDKAKTTPDYFAGPYCRHGLVRLGKDYLMKIDELLGVA